MTKGGQSLTSIVFVIHLHPEQTCFLIALKQKHCTPTARLNSADEIRGYVSLLENAMWERVFARRSTKATKPLGEGGDRSRYTIRPFALISLQSWNASIWKYFFTDWEKATPVCLFFLQQTEFSISKIIVEIWYFSCFIGHFGMLCWELSAAPYSISKSAA